MPQTCAGNIPTFCSTGSEKTLTGKTLDMVVSDTFVSRKCSV